MKACSYQAIDLAAQKQEEELEVSAVVVATGWQPNPLESLPHLGGGKLADVLANVQMERLSSPQGPTSGKQFGPQTQVVNGFRFVLQVHIQQLEGAAKRTVVFPAQDTSQLSPCPVNRL